MAGVNELEKKFSAAQKAHRAGKRATAEERYKDLLRAYPDFAEGWHFLGLLYNQNGDLMRGAEAILKSLELAPDNAVALNNLGEAYHRIGNTSAAVGALQKAIELDPHLAPAHFNLANILKQGEQLDAAIASYQSALQVQPRYPEAWFNLGNTYLIRGLFRSAAEAFENAVALRPEHADARMNLGVAYLELGEVQKAVNRYQDAIKQRPDSADAHRNLGYALEKQGDVRGALESFRKVLVLEPDNDLFRLHVETICPPVMASNAELDAYRYKLKETLNHYRGRQVSPGELVKAGAYFPSLVAYQGGNDLPLKQQWSELFRDHFSAVPSGPRIRKPGESIRVGFVVTHGHEGVFLKCMRGIINRLPEKGDFDVTVVCSIQGGVDILKTGIRHPAIRFLSLPSDLDEAAARTRAANFDILHYWEVGTDALNYFLPFYRPAPIQCATWGWPVTSGIPAIDYFLSSEPLESESSESHYSEKLVRFESLPTYYHVPPVPQNPRPRAAFGLGARDHVYLCTQNLRKVHPDMDRLFEGILEADNRGRILLIQDAQPGVTDLLRRRFRREIPAAAGRIQFLPRLPEIDYLNVVQLADVILDTLHYCGGANTTYDAFAAGAPIITLPMRYHRGRYTAAAYRQIGFTDLVAETAGDYIRIAVELGTDPDLRGAMSRRLREAAPVLFEDERAVEELARFFVGAASGSF